MAVLNVALSVEEESPGGAFGVNRFVRERWRERS
jgi:hypothetical protein